MGPRKPPHPVLLSGDGDWRLVRAPTYLLFTFRQPHALGPPREQGRRQPPSSNRCELWHSQKLEHRRLVPGLAFATRIAYSRSEGFRAAETALPIQGFSGYRGQQKCDGAPGRTRTSTPLQATDFEFAASTVPPLGHSIGSTDHTEVRNGVNLSAIRIGERCGGSRHTGQPPRLAVVLREAKQLPILTSYRKIGT